MDKNSLPKHWQIKTLGEVFFIERGGSPRPIKEFLTNDKNGINWIKIGDTKENSKYIYQTAEKIIPEGLKHSRLVEVGDLILSNSMSFGRPYIMKTTGCIHDGWAALRNQKKIIDENFVYYVLISKQVYTQFQKLATGSTVKNLNIDRIKSVSIPLPPLSEQKQIVSEIERRFEKLDKAIENFRQILKNLKLYRQSVLKFAFDGKFTNPNLTNWQTKPLGEVAITSSGGTPSRKNKYFWENGEINWLKSGELNDNFINFVEEKITKEAINKSSAKILPKGTLLIAMYGATIGRLGILNLETSTNQAICAIQNKKEILFEVKFLFYFLLLSRKKMINEAFGGAQKNISQMYLKNLQIPLPPLSEQKQIVSEIEKRFKMAENLENLIEKSLKNAEILKQSILKEAFSGNLKVKK